MPSSSSSLIHEFGSSIWIVDGPTVDFFGFPYPTRMAIVQLEDKSSWIWSPIEFTDNLLNEMKLLQLDNVQHIVSPNKIHHLFLKQWHDQFPNAKVYASPGLKSRDVAKDIRFDYELDKMTRTNETTINGTFLDTNIKQTITNQINLPEIDQIVVKGSLLMEEVVFFHTKSKTVLITDLIQRFDENSSFVKDGWKGTLMRIDGIVGPNGSTPREWRFSFLVGKEQAKQAKDHIINNWQPKNLLIAHGECVTDGTATDVVSKSLSWLDKCHDMW